MFDLGRRIRILEAKNSKNQRTFTAGRRSREATETPGMIGTLGEELNFDPY
jgi:hypothetical protein